MMINKETLRVHNFAGIHNAEIELSRMNIFIGPQASGKSVCAKLFFFFKETIRRIPTYVASNDAKPQMRASHRDLFLKYFPPSNWSKGTFDISYSFSGIQVKVERKGSDSSTVNIEYSDQYDQLLQLARKAYRKARDESDEFDSNPLSNPVEKTRRIIDSQLASYSANTLSNQNYFIPAGRSFFSTLRSSVFSFIAGDVGIDPFLAEFGRLYESIRRQYGIPTHNRNAIRNKSINDRVSKIICGTYRRTAGNDYIQAEDGRQVSIESSSSGQQEALPLALLLARFGRTSSGTARSTFFVEEPEAHLYPTAQREIVHLLVSITNLTSDDHSSQYVITTHSPYILSSLNNLMYGEQIARLSSRQRVHVAELLGDAATIEPANVRAYAFGDGSVQSIIAEDTGLVKATVLDSVSNELAEEFDALMDIAFEEQAA